MESKWILSKICLSNKGVFIGNRKKKILYFTRIEFLLDGHWFTFIVEHTLCVYMSRKFHTLWVSIAAFYVKIVQEYMCWLVHIVESLASWHTICHHNRLANEHIHANNTHYHCLECVQAPPSFCSSAIQHRRTIKLWHSVCMCMWQLCDQAFVAHNIPLATAVNWMYPPSFNDARTIAPATARASKIRRQCPLLPASIDLTISPEQWVIYLSIML